MPTHKARGPISLSEWIVGTSISSALGPIPPKTHRKQKRRDVVKVTVTTDDEAEEDSLQITYPRTGRTKPATKPVESVVKKVRFEDSPKKSALKKTKVTAVDSAGDTSDSSMGAVCSACGNESSANDTGSEVETSDAAATSSKNKSKQATSAESGESDGCPTCKKAKGSAKSETENSEIDVEETPKKKDLNTKKSKKQDKPDSDTDTSATESQAETPIKSKDKKAKKKEPEPEADKSESEAEIAPTGGRPKGKKKAVEPGTGGETSDSAKESDAESVKPTKKEKTKKKQDKEKPEGSKKSSKEEKKRGKEAKKNEGEESGKSDKKAKQGKHGKEKDKEAKPESSDDESSQEEEAALQSKNGKKAKQKKPANDSQEDAPRSSKYQDVEKHYPEYFPGSHVRRPNLIEPIRAEVVQTERVVETPEDPPPNAFYDPDHHVVRVYYGPVYGKHHSHALYPKRDSANRPLPIGVPHPTENPYYYGFNNVNQQQGYSHVPVTQGMPPPTPWAGMCTQPNRPPGQYGSLPQGIPPAIPPSTPWETQDKGTAAQQQAGPPSSKGKDKDGRNNVVPEPTVNTGTENPYYTRKTSVFSSYGKRTASNKSRKTGSKANSPNSWEKNNNDGAVDWNAPDPNQVAEASAWEITAPPANDTWQTNDESWAVNNDTWGTNNNPQGSWGNQSKGSNGSRNGSKGDHWDAVHKWDTTTNFRASLNGSNKESARGSNSGSTKSKKDDKPMEENNVMPIPGSWIDTPNIVGGADVVGQPWGDPTAAVDTHGEALIW